MSSPAPPLTPTLDGGAINSRLAELAEKLNDTCLAAIHRFLNPSNDTAEHYVHATGADYPDFAAERGDLAVLRERRHAAGARACRDPEHQTESPSTRRDAMVETRPADMQIQRYSPSLATELAPRLSPRQQSVPAWCTQQLQLRARLAQAARGYFGQRKKPAPAPMHSHAAAYAAAGSFFGREDVGNKSGVVTQYQSFVGGIQRGRAEKEEGVISRYGYDYRGADSECDDCDSSYFDDDDDGFYDDTRAAHSGTPLRYEEADRHGSFESSTLQRPNGCSSIPGPSQLPRDLGSAAAPLWAVIYSDGMIGHPPDSPRSVKLLCTMADVMCCLADVVALRHADLGAGLVRTRSRTRQDVHDRVVVRQLEQRLKERWQVQQHQEEWEQELWYEDTHPCGSSVANSSFEECGDEGNDDEIEADVAMRAVDAAKRLCDILSDLDGKTEIDRF